MIPVQWYVYAGDYSADNEIQNTFIWNAQIVDCSTGSFGKFDQGWGGADWETLSGTDNSGRFNTTWAKPRRRRTIVQSDPDTGQGNAQNWWNHPGSSVGTYGMLKPGDIIVAKPVFWEPADWNGTSGSPMTLILLYQEVAG